MTSLRETDTSPRELTLDMNWAVLHITVLLMKRLNKTESAIFLSLVCCLPRLIYPLRKYLFTSYHRPKAWYSCSYTLFRYACGAFLPIGGSTQTNICNKTNLYGEANEGLTTSRLKVRATISLAETLTTDECDRVLICVSSQTLIIQFACVLCWSTDD